MRFLSAFVILLVFIWTPAYAQEPDGQADLSSSWGREDGFPVGNEKLSKAAEFLNAVRPEDFRKSRKPQGDRLETDSASAETR